MYRTQWYTTPDRVWEYPQCYIGGTYPLRIRTVANGRDELSHRYIISRNRCVERMIDKWSNLCRQVWTRIMNTRYQRYGFVSVNVTRVNSCEQKETSVNESEQLLWFEWNRRTWTSVKHEWTTVLSLLIFFVWPPLRVQRVFNTSKIL